MGSWTILVYPRFGQHTYRMSMGSWRQRASSEGLYSRGTCSVRALVRSRALTTRSVSRDDCQGAWQHKFDHKSRPANGIRMTLLWICSCNFRVVSYLYIRRGGGLERGRKVIGYSRVDLPIASA